jgi:hypothetical protein
MDLAESAVLESMQGNIEKAAGLFKQAFDAELLAVGICETEKVPEPTYSVIHRSAASLALDCKKFRYAEKLIAKALAGEPPYEIANELRDLLEQVHFNRHLDLRGVSLAQDEVQLSIAGKGVGFGMADSSEFIERIDNTSKIIYRLVERKQRRPFREQGRIKKTLKDNYELFISAPRAASFAVSLKLGQPKDQLNSPEILGTTEILDEFLDLLSLLNNKEEVTLKEKIGDDAYFRNFVGLSKLLAPDGDEVNMVGFTTFRNGKENRVLLTRKRDEISQIQKTASTTQTPATPIKVEGQLLFADATGGAQGQIKIVEKDGKEYLVSVPEGMMNDIVRPLWGLLVSVAGFQSGKAIILEDIKKIEPDGE